jgi:hypothetical protein
VVDAADLSVCIHRNEPVLVVRQSTDRLTFEDGQRNEPVCVHLAAASEK